MRIYVAILAVIEIILFIFNFKPGTWLMGWDVVMPEFNTWLNIERSISAIWQSYRGLGLMDGMAHSANLTHSLYVWVLSVVVPPSAIRYVFLHLTHLVGGIGMFCLLKHILERRTQNLEHEKTPSSTLHVTSISAFFGSLFYMLNIGIIQMYSTPLEVFAIHFSALPILALWIFKSLEMPSRKNLLILLLASFLLSGQSFVPTVFLAYLVLVGAILAVHAVRTKQLKRVFVILAVILAANAFWLIPYAYSVPANSKVIQNARINQFSSEEIFYRNKAFGTIDKVLGLNGFIMESVEYDTTQSKNTYLMESWHTYQKTMPYLVSYGIVLLIVLSGLISALKNKKSDVLSISLAGTFAFLFLANNTPGFSQINDLIRLVFPVIGEAFRFPFTKFVTLFALSLSVLFGFGLMQVSTLLKQLNAKILVVVVSVLLLIISYPVFSSGFMPGVMKPSLPQGYQAMMNYTNSLPDGRIALLPAQTFWNWGYRSWGYRGSDFLWYGIKHPMLMRAFDPWSKHNEQFYNELSYSISTENHTAFHGVLKKYKVRYLLLDESFRNSASTKPVNYEKLRLFISQTPEVIEKQRFDALVLYEFTGSTADLQTNLQTIPSGFSYTHFDQIFGETGGYAQDSQGTLLYPFTSLYTGKLQQDHDFEVEKQDNLINIHKDFSPPLHLDQNTQMVIPSYLDSEQLIPAVFEQQGSQLKLSLVYPRINFDNSSSELEAEEFDFALNSSNPITEVVITNTGQKTTLGELFYIQNKTINTFQLRVAGGTEIETLDLTNSKGDNRIFVLEAGDYNRATITMPLFISPYSFLPIEPSRYGIKTITDQFSPYEPGVSMNQTKKEGGIITFTVRKSASELAMYLESLDHRASYLILVESEHTSGLPVHFYIDNSYEKRPELESRLSKKSGQNAFILPPTQNYFSGYGFHFITKSLGTESAVNSVGPVSILPIPMTLITGMKIPIRESLKTATYLTNNQAYSPGWIALADNKILPGHTLVNGWENGWLLPSDPTLRNSRYTILFWPQYLQYLGFIILALTPLLILKFVSKSPTS